MIYATTIIIFLHCQPLCHVLIAPIFYQNRPKIELLLPIQKFQALGIRPQTPQTVPSLQISGYTPA